MADIKISQLGAAVAVSDTDVLPLVNSANPATTNKVTAETLKEYVIGDTDISAIGDGSATGAISALKSGKTEGTAISENIETIGSTAIGDYASGDTFLASNGNYYEATAAITGGTTTLTVGTNCKLSTVDEQLTSLKEALTNTKDSVTNIDITGSTNNTGSTITSGTFFYLNGALVRAKTNIANGATLTLNTNYKLVTAGGLNELNSDLISNSTLSGYVTNDYQDLTDAATFTVARSGFYRIRVQCETSSHTVIAISHGGSIYWIASSEEGAGILQFVYLCAGIPYTISSKINVERLLLYNK